MENDQTTKNSLPSFVDRTLTLDEVGELGTEIYERLKSILEAESWNRYVAIHVLTGDYVVDTTTGNAMRAIRKIHKRGQLFLRKIGNEPEYGLAARILAGEMMAAKAASAK